MRWLFSRRPALDLPALDGGVARHAAVVLAAAGVPRFRDALPRMVLELERARRYGRPLSVALVGPESAHAHEGNGGSSPVSHNGHSGSAPPTSGPLFAALLGSLLRELMRETDIVAYAAALDRCVIVMPEMGEEESRLAVRRLRELCAARLGVPIRTQVAAFPHDGLTLEELLKLAEARSRVLEPARTLQSAPETTAL